MLMNKIAKTDIDPSTSAYGLPIKQLSDILAKPSVAEYLVPGIGAVAGGAGGWLLSRILHKNPKKRTQLLYSLVGALGGGYAGHKYMDTDSTEPNRNFVTGEALPGKMSKRRYSRLLPYIEFPDRSPKDKRETSLIDTAKSAGNAYARALKGTATDKERWKAYGLTGVYARDALAVAARRRFAPNLYNRLLTKLNPGKYKQINAELADVAKTIGDPNKLSVENFEAVIGDPKRRGRWQTLEKLFGSKKVTNNDLGTVIDPYGNIRIPQGRIKINSKGKPIYTPKMKPLGVKGIAGEYALMQAMDLLISAGVNAASGKYNQKSSDNVLAKKWLDNK